MKQSSVITQPRALNSRPTVIKSFLVSDMEHYDGCSIYAPFQDPLKVPTLVFRWTKVEVLKWKKPASPHSFFIWGCVKWPIPQKWFPTGAAVHIFILLLILHRCPWCQRKRVHFDSKHHLGFHFGAVTGQCTPPIESIIHAIISWVRYISY